MTDSDTIGWIAAAATLLTFSMQAMVPLRIAAIFANMCFIAYGAMAGLIPVFVLHLALLPCNLTRLAQALRPSGRPLRRRARAPKVQRRPVQCRGRRLRARERSSRRCRVGIVRAAVIIPVNAVTPRRAFFTTRRLLASRCPGMLQQARTAASRKLEHSMTPAPTGAQVVSRMWWKFPGGALRACDVGSSQAATSRGIGASG